MSVAASSPATTANAFRLRPGSFLWLVSYDLTLSWRRIRGMFGGLRPRTITIILGLAILSFHAIAYPVANWFGSTSASGSFTRSHFPALASAMLFILPWLISQALTNSTRALYSRGDLDLLFASPLPAARVLAARALAVAVESISSVAIFIIPIANMNILVNGWHWLSIYPALAACGLFATAIGVLLMLGLFKLAGPRKTRIVSQIIATIIGAAFVLLLQAINILPAQMRDALVEAIESPGGGWLFDSNGVIWLPVRAAAGDISSLLLWCAVSIAAFAATAIGLGKLFAASAVQSANAPAQVASLRRRNTPIRFRAGLGRALRVKEWRLLSRDPWLISQIMLQIVYTLPVSIIIWRSQGPNGSIALSVAPAIVVISAQISASLAWLTISSEDAPEFIASAPVTRAEIERRKLQAIAFPLVCFLALPVLGLAWFSLEAAVYAIVFAVGASLSTAFLNLWHPMPARRAMVLRRHSQSKLIAIMEHLLSLLWAVAMVMAILESYFAAIPLAIVAGILFANRPRKAASGKSKSGSKRPGPPGRPVTA